MTLVDNVRRQMVRLQNVDKVPRVLRCDRMTFHDLERETYGLSQPFTITATPKLTIFGLLIEFTDGPELLVTE